MFLRKLCVTFQLEFQIANSFSDGPVVVNGKSIAQQINTDLQNKVNYLKDRKKSILKNPIPQNIIYAAREPSLGIILVGSKPASISFVNRKIRSCNRVGIKHELIHFPQQSSKEEIISAISRLNERQDIDSILVQLPLPQHLNRMEIINALDQSKDVDCLQSMNVSSFEPFQEQPLSINNNSDNLQQYNNVNPQNFFFEHPIVPCAPAACIYILDYYQIKLSGIQTTIVGRGPLVGYPLSLMLLKQQAKVTICHQKTQNIMDHIKRSDLIIAAAGVRHLIQADWINPGSIVIDVGINAGLKGIDPHQYIGDVQFQEAQKRAHLITPVPGGVGPVTVSMLLRNIVSMWQKNHLSFMHQKKEQRIKDLDDFEVKGVYKSKISMSF